MHGVNAFAQGFERLIAEEHPMSATAKSVKNELRLARSEQNNRSGTRPQGVEFAQDAVPLERPLFQLSADDRHIRLALLQQSERMFRSNGARNDGYSGALRPE